MTTENFTTELDILDLPVRHVRCHYNLNNVSGRYRFDTLERLVEFCEEIDLDSSTVDDLIWHLGNMFDATNCAIHDYSRGLDNERRLWTLPEYNSPNAYTIHTFFETENDSDTLLLDRLDSAFQSVIETIKCRIPDVILVDDYYEQDELDKN